MTQQTMTKEQILEKCNLTPSHIKEIVPRDGKGGSIFDRTVLAMEHYKEQEVAKERESHINMVKQIVELLGFAKCLNILDALEKWQKEREKAKKLMEALEKTLRVIEDYEGELSLGYIFAKQSLTEYEKL